jgi:hypothetical protein
MSIKDIIGLINALADADDITETARRKQLHEFAWVLVNATREEETNG